MMELRPGGLMSSSTTAEPRRTWIPISVFIGTSLALAIPLVVLRRQRAAVLQVAPPPRRVASSPSSLPRPSTLPDVAPENIFSSTDSDRASLNTMSAFSHMNASSAMLGAKAFVIATGIVAVVGTTFVWSVKEVLGVKDAPEFGNKMRSMLSNLVPSLSDAIYQLPKTEEADRPDTHEADVKDWKWKDAEKRLKRAYEDGGISHWGRAALRELEAEAALERKK